jgi:hypothetical protein
VWNATRTRWSDAAFDAEYGLFGAYGVVSVKPGRVGRERPVHLVGRDVQEPERLALARGQRGDVRAHRLEQLERADDVGLDERVGAVDRAVDVRLGREVHDRARLVLAKQAHDRRAVADVAAHERVARVAAQRREVAEVARVGELVEVQHRLAGRGDPVEDEVGADEAGAAGDEDHGSGTLACAAGGETVGSGGRDFSIQAR